jgi:arylsulfatase A-like enzyme
MYSYHFVKPTILSLVFQLVNPSAVSLASESSHVKPPNIVFIYADDWGWGDLGCHGHPELKTPNIDKLASQGIDFHRFTVGNPVCSPSRATIMTGQYPARHRIHGAISTEEKNAAAGIANWLDPNVTVLPRLFKEAGYKTAHFGKWHLSLHGSNITSETPRPEAYGFDEAAVWTGPGKSVFEGSSYEDKAGRAMEPISASYMTAAAVEHAINFITRVKDEAFFMNIWIHETHTAVSATEEDRKEYPDTPEPFQTYYAAATRADRLIGKVLETLNELGLENNTIVIFSSDNGPEDFLDEMDHVRYYSVGSTGGLRGQKRSLYLGGVNTPFIVRWPGHIPAGKIDSTSIISGVDMLPTLCAAASIPLPESYKPDGMNVLPAFKGEIFERTKPLFWQWRGPYNREANWPQLAMQDGDWILLTASKPERIELYNIATDRSQQNNLSIKYPERTSAMMKELLEWEATLPPTP